MPKGLLYLVCALLGAASYLIFLMLPPTPKQVPLLTKDFKSDVVSALDTDASDTPNAGSCADDEPCTECGEQEVDVDVRTLTAASVVDNESMLTSAGAARTVVDVPPQTVDKPQADEAGGKTRAQLLAQKLLSLDEELKRQPGPKRVQFRQGEGEAEPGASGAEEPQPAGARAEEVAGVATCTAMPPPKLGPFGGQAVGGAACTATPPLLGPFGDYGDQVAGVPVCTATPPLLGPYGNQGVGAPACPAQPPLLGPVAGQVCGLNPMYGLNMVTFVSGVPPPPPPDTKTAPWRVLTQPGQRKQDWGQCWQWKEKGWCAKGSACRWAHPRDDEECSLHFAVMLDTSTSGGRKAAAGSKAGRDTADMEKGRSSGEDGAASGADAGAYLTDDGY